MRRVLILLWCLCLAAGTGTFVSGRAETEQECMIRIRPRVERADAELGDGIIAIGSARRGQRTAQIRIGTAGRSPEGNEWDLPALIAKRGGTVERAVWRIEAKESSTELGTFLLWPEGNRKKSRTVAASAGWNLWDMTEWTRDILEGGEDFSFRIQAADGATGDGAAFDFEHSRIYVTIRLQEAEPEMEANSLADSELLDIALSALPAEHWALRRYQEETGSLIQARWPETGVPYYFGGHSEEKVMHRFFPLQESRYYRSDRLYLCGFDCGSFLHWVEEKAGYQPQDELSEILKARADAFPLQGVPLAAWRTALLPGDMIIFNHGTYHIGMILGTPRLYGLNEENAPELAGWLDYPMMIHCGEDPFCYDRFRDYIQKQAYRMDTTPPDGGVTVSLLTEHKGDAPHIRQAPWGKEYGYFSVMGQEMTVFPLDDCREMAWMRPGV